MTAVSVINMVLPIVAALAFVAAVVFIVRGVRRRTHSARAPYNVGRQEARQGMQHDFVRALVALAVSLILFGVFLLLPGPTEAEPALIEMPAPTAELATPVPLTDTPLPVSPTPLPLPTAPPTVAVITPAPIPTSTQTPLPLPTEAPGVKTAVVTSGVGVWLRSTPSVDGEQVEWLLTNAEVVLLAGQATADEFDWREVQSSSGNVGWVAVPFIEILDEPTE